MYLYVIWKEEERNENGFFFIHLLLRVLVVAFKCRHVESFFISFLSHCIRGGFIFGAMTRLCILADLLCAFYA